MMGIKIGIILISFLCSTYFFYKASGTLNPRKLNIISCFYYLFILQTFIGIALIILGWDKHYTLDKLVEREQSIQTGFVVIMLISIMFPLISWSIEKVCKVNMKIDYSRYLEVKPTVKNDYQAFRLLCIGTLFSITLLIIWIIQVGYVPAFMLLFAPEGFDFAFERIRITNLYFFHPYVKNILILSFIPLLSYIVFSYMLKIRKKKWYILFGILFFASILTKTYNFEKSPIVFHLAVFVLIMVYHKGGISWKILGISGIFAVMGIALMYLVTGYEGTFIDIYNGPVGRILFSQLGSLLYTFDAFPSLFGFLMGRSLPGPLLPLLGWDPEMHLRSAKVLMAFYGSSHVYDGTAGVMSGFFAGEAYANFGWTGVAFAVIWISLLLTLIFVIILKLKKTPISIAFLATMTVKLVLTTQSGFFDFIFNVDYIFTALVFGAGYFLIDSNNRIGRWVMTRLFSIGLKNQ